MLCTFGSSAVFLLALVGIQVYYAACLPEYCGQRPGDFIKQSERDEVRGYKLKQVHVVIRHGDRTRAGYHGPCWPDDKAEWDCTLTSSSLPTIKHDQHYLSVDRLYRKVFINGRNAEAGDCALGALTYEGYTQQEMNGRVLKIAYINTGFLKPNYSYSDMYIRSDDMSRTMQSAQSLVLGMYPPSTIASDRAQVFDIHTMDMTFDSIEPNTLLCPKLAEYNNEFMESAAWNDHYNAVTKPLLEEVKKAMGYNHTFTIDKMDDLVDCLHTHICHGFKTPAAITDFLFKRMVDDLVYRWNSMYEYPTREKYATVGIGFLIKDIWQEMQNSMKGESGKKFLLYSGHDGTLQPFLSAFNVTDHKWPPYASVIQLELLETTGAPSMHGDQYAVRMLYHGQQLTFPFCDATPCSLTQFEAYINTIIPHNPAQDCQVSDPSILNKPPIRFLPGMGGRGGM